MYVKITPSKAQASLRNLANGREPKIPVAILADYLLHHGSPSMMSGSAPKDDFVRFAEHLFALNDPRGAFCCKANPLVTS
ncbi:MAG TPA: hypothetical protein VM554_03540 [Acidisarcina sp.]|nr:hypothetical protein [Acidisarcina sp.]